MVLLLVCALLGGYMGYKISRNRHTVLEKTGVVILGVTMGMALATVVVMFYLAIMPPKTVSFEIDKVKLTTLGDTSELEGSFFLASGHVGSEEFYKFYYETPGGGKRFGKLPAEDVTVFEENRQDAYLSKAGKQQKYTSQVYFWLIPKFLLWKDWKYVVHVPKGTIKVEYNLDLK